MMDDTPEPARPRRRPRLPLGWVIALVVAAACAALWWWEAPRPMRLVGQYAPDQAGWFTDDGRITGEFTVPWEPTVLTLTDWHGRRRWQVTLPPADYSGWAVPLPPRTLPPADYSSGWVVPLPPRTLPPVQWTLSPDGRVLAAAIPRKDALHVATWRAGVPLGAHTLPVGPGKTLPNDALPTLLVRDDGRVFLWLPHAVTSPILVIEGDRLLAQGTHVMPPGVVLYTNTMRAIEISTGRPIPYRRRAIAQDGTTLVHEVSYRMTPGGAAEFQQEYATLAIKGTRVVAISRHTRTSTGMDLGSRLFSGGAVLLGGKQLVRPDGTSTTFTDWAPEYYYRLVRPSSTTIIVTDWAPANWYTPGETRFLLQRHATDESRYRLYDTGTDAVWDLPALASTVEALGHSADGRYVVLRERGEPTTAVTRLAFRIPWLGSRAKTLLARRDALCIYSRPGRLRARLPLDPETEIYHIWLTPDGRKMVVVRSRTPSAGNAFPVEIAVYAW